MNNPFDLGKSAVELFQESKIGNFIQHLAVENQNEATRLYMSDFVKMSHKASCSREEMVMGYIVSDEKLILCEYWLI